MPGEENRMNPKSYTFMARLAGHNIIVIFFLIAMGLVIFLTAFNENLIFQYSKGSELSLSTTLFLTYLGIAVVIGGIIWIILVLIARRKLTFQR